MKRNEILSEHKKGVRAMKYTKKTKSTVPVYGPEANNAKLKPVKPVGLQEDDALKVKAVSGNDVTLDQNGQEIKTTADALTPGQQPGTFAMKPSDPTAIKPGATVTTSDATMEEEGEELITSPHSAVAANLAKLARVVKSVQTPEQFAAAKQYAHLMFKKLNQPNIKAGFSKYGDSVELMRDVEADLRAKREELGLTKDHHDMEFEENFVKSIKRGLHGWGGDALGQGGSPRDVVNRNKGHDDETLKMLKARAGVPTAHSPAGLQDRVISRELNKRGISESAALESMLRIAGLR